MRLGVLADVHGNLPALEAAVGRLRRERVDGFLCLGDLVGYGPWPEECVALVASLEPVCVAGNHDLLAVGRAPLEEVAFRLARTTLEWTRERLSPASRAYLEALPLRADAAGGLVLAHGSLDDPTRYVRTEEAGREQLALVPEARALLLGHTHAPWLLGPHGAEPRGPGRAPLPPHALLNPGSVGQSRARDPLSRYALLDLAAGTADFYAEPWDTAAARRELRRHGLPPGALHLRPKRLRPLRRIARRLVDAARPPRRARP